MNQPEKDKKLDNRSNRNVISSLSNLLNQMKDKNPILTSCILSFSGFIFYLLHREKHKQKELSKAPILFFQDTKQNAIILNGMDNTILFRKIVPKFIVGTNALLNSIMACTYYHKDSSSGSLSSEQHMHSYTMREMFTIPIDGATIGIDWEVPNNINKKEILNGPISKAVILIIHGYNNDTSTPYVRNIMMHCAKHGFIVAGMNLRWSGNVKGTTPRGSTAAYTGDIRSIVHTLDSRLKTFSKPLILIGYSMGANLITKYLGEESLANTLPKCIIGGISLANPLSVEPGNITFPFSMILTIAMRQTILKQWSWISPMMKNDYNFRKSIYNLLLKCWNITKTDEYTSLYMVRNQSSYPFQTQIGYLNPNEYRIDTRSYNYIRNISTVPLLMISAMDDFLVHENAMLKLGYSYLVNPNILVCMTYTGGHLGWFEDGTGRSWADDAVLSFVKSIVNIHENDNANMRKKDDGSISQRRVNDDIIKSNRYNDGLHATDFIYSKL